MKKTLCALLVLLAPSFTIAVPPPELLEKSPKEHWRRIDPDNLLMMELPQGLVYIELAASIAPQNVANIKTLVREGYFDGSAVLRSQDNFVVQWGHPEDAPRTFKKALKKVKAEFDVPLKSIGSFTALPDVDTYAPQVGFVSGFPAARDEKAGKAWLVHCYGMVGVARDVDADSGNGSELYVVDGHSPRNLDRNISLVGRVVKGIELLSVLPRGKGELGFYQKPSERTPIKSVKIVGDLDKEYRIEFEALRTDSDTFKTYVEDRRNRKEAWYKYAAGRVGVCNVSLPVRPVAGVK